MDGRLLQEVHQNIFEDRPPYHVLVEERKEIQVDNLLSNKFWTIETIVDQCTNVECWH